MPVFRGQGPLGVNVGALLTGIPLLSPAAAPGAHDPAELTEPVLEHVARLVRGEAAGAGRGRGVKLPPPDTPTGTPTDKTHTRTHQYDDCPDARGESGEGFPSDPSEALDFNCFSPSFPPPQLTFAFS